MEEEIRKLNNTLSEADRMETLARIEFSNFLCHWRVNKDISLRELGELTGFSAAYLSDVERNARRASHALLQKLKLCCTD